MKAHLPLAATLLLAAAPAWAADPATEELLREVRRLNQRIEQLERQGVGAQAAPARLAERVKKLEEDKAILDKSLKADYISADEPPLAARLKAVETQAASHDKTSKMVEGLDGIKVGLSGTMMGQAPSGHNLANQESQLNARADVTVTLPGGEFGESKGEFFAHVRAGQGGGLGTLNRSFASVNATAFQRPGADNSDSAIVLAQLWYQLNVPIDGEKNRIEITLGKMDPFGFFDQNKVAGDETRAFVNQAFVHNPLLDVGGDIGIDGLGFSPGLRVAYVNEVRKGEAYGVSAGVYESGAGASFQNSLDFPFTIVQVETTQTPLMGLEGTYRLYGWHNRRGQNYDNVEATHGGIGLSLDQKVANDVTLFGRYGHQLSGKTRIDRALTVGAEVGGNYWKRGTDAVGVAAGWLGTSGSFRRDSLALDADNDGTADFGYRARGAEQMIELYYRYGLLPGKVELTPSLQYIRNAGANPAADGAYAVGLRVQATY